MIYPCFIHHFHSCSIIFHSFHIIVPYFPTCFPHGTGPLSAGSCAAPILGDPQALDVPPTTRIAIPCWRVVWWFVKSNCIQFVIDNDINQYIIVRIMIVKASFDKKQWEWSSLCKHGIWNMIVWTAAIWLHNALHATASPWDDDPQERREPSKCRHRGIRKPDAQLGQKLWRPKSVNGNFRILKWRYLPYIRPI